MGTHVTLLVHGIGEQVAGETVDEFVGAARQELKLDCPVENNSVLLSEPEIAIPEAKRGHYQLQQYPCEMRRLRKGEDELLFAEVHWSDLSKAPMGLFATVLDLLRLVLGLGYLALDNVENNGGSGWGLIRPIVHIFVWVFFFILAPLNALILVGSLGLLVDFAGMTLGTEDGQWSPLVLLFAMGGGLTFVSGLIAWRADTYLKRLFFSGTALLGVIALAISVGSPFGFSFPINETWIPACIAVDSFLYGVPPGINCFAGTLVFALNTVWLFEVGLFLILCVLSLFSKTLFSVEKRSIYLAICAAMLMFWMTFSVAFWSVLRGAVGQLGGGSQTVLLTRVFDQHFDEATNTLPYVVFAVIIVMSVGALIWLHRVVAKVRFGGAASLDKQQAIRFSRLILNPSVNSALFLSSLLLVVGALYATAEWWLVDGRTDFSGVHKVANMVIWNLGSFADSLLLWSGLAVTLVGAVGLLIVNNAGFIAAALGVGRDIVIYATRSHLDSPSRPISKIRRMRQALFKNSYRPSQYIYRERIEARFRETFERVLAQEKNVDKVTIVSHSQGTVVSVMGLLWLADSGGQAAHNFLKKLTLVTMGCPLQHVYRHYFHENYEVGQADWHREDKWFNIYRVDDFVGKTVGGKGLSVTDVPVLAAKGHSHYWSDQLVWNILKDKGIY